MKRDRREGKGKGEMDKIEFFPYRRSTERDQKKSRGKKKTNEKRMGWGDFSFFWFLFSLLFNPFF